PQISDPAAQFNRQPLEEGLERDEQGQGELKISVAQTHIRFRFAKAGAPKQLSELGEGVLLQMEPAGNAIEIARHIVRAIESARSHAKIDATGSECTKNVL